ncbi:MAG: hypothetical protein ACM3ZR_04040 [Pseudomonadota bacterium]
MRKLLIMVLSLALIFSFSACSGSSDSGSGGAKPENTPPANESGTKTESPSEAQSAGGDQSWPVSTIYNVPEWETSKSIMAEAAHWTIMPAAQEP